MTFLPKEKIANFFKDIFDQEKFQFHPDNIAEKMQGEMRKNFFNPLRAAVRDLYPTRDLQAPAPSRVQIQDLFPAPVYSLPVKTATPSPPPPPQTQLTSETLSTPPILAPTKKATTFSIEESLSVNITSTPDLRSLAPESATTTFREITPTLDLKQRGHLINSETPQKNKTRSGKAKTRPPKNKPAKAQETAKEDTKLKGKLKSGEELEKSFQERQKLLNDVFKEHGKLT